jgi:hypothetical protein
MPEEVQPERSARIATDASGRVRVLLERAQHSPACHGPNFQGLWSGDMDEAVTTFEQRIGHALRVPQVEPFFQEPWPPEARAVLPSMTRFPALPEETVKPLRAEDVKTNGDGVDSEILAAETGGSADGNGAERAIKQTAIWGTVLAWCAMEALGRVCNPKDPEHSAAQLFDTLRLREQMAEGFGRLGMTGEDRWRAAARLRIAFAHRDWAPQPGPADTGFTAPLSWVHDPDVAWLIGVHEYQGVRYFVKEPYEELLWWMALRWLVDIAAEPTIGPKAISALEEALRSRMHAAQEAGYRVESLLEMGR